MHDHDCVAFLRWVLPQLQMRWSGFRKVRGQVCKRVSRRIGELQLNSVTDYQRYLGSHAEEWSNLAALCRITISRFYRDRGVFRALEQEVIPALAKQIRARDDATLTAWSAGSGSGEEPYTLAILWYEILQPRFPDLEIRILATDIDSDVLQRAKRGCYAYGTLKALPTCWRENCFAKRGDVYCLHDHYRRIVTFVQHDLRSGPPDGEFDLLFCRNLAFTYYDDLLQIEVLKLLWQSLLPHSALVIGAHENLPQDVRGFQPWPNANHIYRQVPDLDEFNPLVKNHVFLR